jgi:hypothetical protein
MILKVKSQQSLLYTQHRVMGRLPYAFPIYQASRFHPFLYRVGYVDSVDLPSALFLNALCNSVDDSI